MRCESCGHEFSGSYGEACPACGTVARNPFAPTTPSAESAPAGSGPSPWQAPRTMPGTEDGFAGSGDGIPWEGVQSVQTAFETIKKVLLDAQNTFAGASKNVGIGPAFIYVLVLGVAGGLIGQVWGLAYSGMMSSLAGMEGMEGMGGVGALAFSGVAGFLMVPVWVVISAFVVSGLVHLSLMIVGGANAGFESTFRVVAYAQGSTALLNVVPIVGALVAMIWGIVAGIMGLKELHGITTGKAAAGALLPLGICCCGAGALGVIAGMAAGSLANL